jgi:hypothetical protein
MLSHPAKQRISSKCGGALEGSSRGKINTIMATLPFTLKDAC